MQILKACWALNFFLLGLVFFFIWSKMLVVSKRVVAIVAVLQDIEKIESPTVVSAPQVKSATKS